VQAVPITSKVVSSNTVHGRGVLDTTLYDTVCQLIVTGQWFSPGAPVSLTNKTESHDIAEILLKVALDIIKLNLNQYLMDPSTIFDRV
jgi:hypothetical protein